MPLAMAVVDMQKAPAPETFHGQGEFWYLQSQVTCGALHGTEGLVARGGGSQAPVLGAWGTCCHRDLLLLTTWHDLKWVA